MARSRIMESYTNSSLNFLRYHPQNPLANPNLVFWIPISKYNVHLCFCEFPELPHPARSGITLLSNLTLFVPLLVASCCMSHRPNVFII